MSVPRVSIGMPVYNGQDAVRKALDTLLVQTFSDFELIVSDNASTDATGDICREYAARDRRIQYIRQAENLGAARNFEFVLARAQAEYFMWAAHDDYWHPEFLRKCLAAHEQDALLPVVFTQYWVLSREYAPLKMRRFPDLSFLADEDPFSRVSRYLLLSEFTHKANVIYGLWKKAAVRDMTQAFHGVDSRLVDYGFDIAQIAYVLVRSRVHQIPEVLFFKTYAGLPPGYVTRMGRIVKRRLFKHARWKKRYEQNVRSHIEIVRIALARAGAGQERYNQFLDLFQDRLLHRYDRPSDLLRELYRSVKAGLV
jgi:glycosyltransferase involved in cell wall biosynthesis